MGELALVSELRKRLAVVVTPAETKTVEGEAQRLRDMYVLANDVVAANEYAEIAIEAARQLGEIFGDGEQGKRNDLSGASDKFDIPKQTKTDYRNLARKSADVVQDYKDVCLESGDIMSKRGLLRYSPEGKKEVVRFSGDYEWYTPEVYVEKIRKAMGSIDLDPASCLEAQEVVQAAKYYTSENNGVDENNEWHGNVFCNPPFCQPEIADFSDRIIAEMHHGSIDQAILLTNNSSDASWFQNAAQTAGVVCFTDGRISFTKGGESSSPLRGQAFFYFGRRREAFIEEFKDVGVIMVAVNGAT